MKLKESTKLTLVQPWLLRVSQILDEAQIESLKTNWDVIAVTIEQGNTFFELAKDMGQTQL